ncbi:CHAT domain-containing protein [Streptosporangium sp. V21-05]|uniref:CHAT domain-containing protein n=1 Tax=Streptosporangium sp. V21-05 TaxID=3446115 RepID=UPI003F53AC81
MTLRNPHIFTADGPALGDALHAAREAVARVRPGDPIRASCLTTLGNVLEETYLRHDDDASLTESVAAPREAMRFLVRGGEADLDEAVRITREALEMFPLPWYSRHMLLPAYAEAIAIRSAYFGDLSALPEAAGALEETIDAVPPGTAGRPFQLDLLGTIQLLRFQADGDVTWLHEGVRRKRQALGETGPAMRDTPLMLSGLAAALRITFDHTGERPVLDEAVELCRTVTTLAPPGTRSGSGGARELGQILLRRARLTGDPGELAEAVRLLREADDPVGVGDAMTERFARSGDPADLDEALRTLREFTRSPARSLSERLRASWKWGEAAAGFATAVRLLPLATTRRLPRAEQERALGSNAYFGLDAAACALQRGQTLRAPESLEYGRGLLFAQAMETRSDLGELEERAPEPALRVRRLRDLLDQGPAIPGTTTTTMTTGLTAEHRWRLAAEWEESLREVRAMGLLSPPRGEDLVAAVGEDPVVIVNVSPYRSDALILRGGGVESVRLPLLDRDTSTYHAVRFHLAVEGAMDRRLAVVSSYTTTLLALRRARRRPPAPPRPRRPLVVAVDRTPGMSDLPATVGEAERIAHRIPGALLLGSVSRERLLAALPSHTWPHFAGHAYADPHRPSRSHLALGGDRLDILDIARQDPPDAELAHLSACHTAASKGRIADEAIHLAPAFQLAGYEHVIVTLWNIRDDVAAQAADHVYARLDPGPPLGTGVADAVHGASLALRERYPGRPDLWAALVHTGPQDSGGAPG